MRVKRQKLILTSLGWRTDTRWRRKRAIKDFQRGWLLGKKLVVDGIVGPKTTEAMELSYSRLQNGEPTCSEHFSFSEFACKCGGRYWSCKRIATNRRLIRGLEKYRSVAGRTIIVSAYRCYWHNRAVGGAKYSQHKYAKAADLVYSLGLGEVKELEAFSGIGYSVSRGLVRHVDVRDNATVSNPTVWTYA
ncbi:D-Ala-D-Ala carboxypeptidase family metallohydrolase [Neptunomonas sp.]|uniref:D-Ala-D-Ala carboxypeptidase family metallohydrolase n=1 Tax=Neptunomonas sp. TaxID=1971898 RepID=UPI003562E0F3